MSWPFLLKIYYIGDQKVPLYICWTILNAYSQNGIHQLQWDWYKYAQLEVKLAALRQIWNLWYQYDRVLCQYTLQAICFHTFRPWWKHTCLSSILDVSKCQRLLAITAVVVKGLYKQTCATLSSRPFQLYSANLLNWKLCFQSNVGDAPKPGVCHTLLNAC